MLLPTDTTEVKGIINDLKQDASPGLDGIPASMVKFAVEYIAKPLSYLINNSFQTGEFPDKLKHAKVIPIFKAGDHACFSNYRPISILPAFSKIFEKALVSRINGFLEKHNILYRNQYGFKKNTPLPWPY